MNRIIVRPVKPALCARCAAAAALGILVAALAAGCSREAQPAASGRLQVGAMPKAPASALAKAPPADQRIAQMEEQASIASAQRQIAGIRGHKGAGTGPKQ